MYGKSAGARFDSWNQESWSSSVEDWNHFHSELHCSPSHHSYSHAHHHHHSHHLSPHQHYSNHHANIHQNPSQHVSGIDSNTVRARTYSEQTESGRICYPYTTNNQTVPSNETFGPSRIEYCETYPTNSHHFQQEYSYYEHPEQCNYNTRQWSNQNQFSQANTVSMQEAHPVSSQHSHNLHCSPSHTHSDVVAYHRYESTGQSVTNVTNNFSVNLAVNIPALPVTEASHQTTVASTIQYKIQTQLEKRITITPQQLKPSQVQSGQLTCNSPSSQNSQKSNVCNISQESLYNRLKHYRISKHNTNYLHSKNEDNNDDDCQQNNAQNQNICFICGKNYARPSTLKTHLRTHSGEKPYRCHFCGKAFTQAANLTAHIRTHSGEKPFPCPVCKRRFSQSSSVTTHLRIHSGERPYLCNYCRKSFSDSSTLTKHLRIHSGEKPYQCRMCTLRFSQSGNLNRHMRVHL